jgi:hypothetical protein
MTGQGRVGAPVGWSGGARAAIGRAETEIWSAEIDCKEGMRLCGDGDPERGFLFYRTRRGLRGLSLWPGGAFVRGRWVREAGRVKERAVVFARPVNDPLLYFLVVEIYMTYYYE